MAFGYVELILALGSNETLTFDIKDSDGVATDISSFTSGTCSLTNIDRNETKQVGTVTIQPDGVIGRVKVSILADDMDGADDFFEQNGEDLYGMPPLNFAISIKLDNEVKVRGKVRIVKVG